MSFFSKLFKKDRDYTYYLAQGDKYLAGERYADARVEYQEAQACCPADAAEDLKRIADGLGRAGNSLGELNFEEGTHAANAGDLQKASDHFSLVLELAADPALRSRATSALRELNQAKNAPAAAVKKAPAAHAHKSSCGSCGDHGKHADTPVEMNSDDVHEEDRFYLLVQPLPGDLPERYCALGPKFAHAYLLIHEGDDAAAFPILKEMLLSSENDIVIYELALIMYRGGRAHECEELLNRGLKINPDNATLYLALVHLKSDAGRFAEAIDIVTRMQQRDLLPDQAQFLLGELHQASGDNAAALEAWSKALQFKSMAKPAAERLVPLLASQGRDAEAKFLAKQYLKGCC
ncbi:hypothetical protein GMST_22530 [Geomonas silvestris]|uniref:Tetratricopeptide repeat protein n=1 Tax=Geomonas silvestris TaxID=2740184 RepID=A0A6V8MIX5_9BACT|nr:hypothetical protein [Geomonas silvestris]GFO59928.1 hypothetical protein GMST_22530 [Geomonas silvestris]